MATGILPDKYQAYRNGQISYEEATGQKSNIPAPAAPKATTNNSTPYSQGNNYGVSYTPNTPAPAVYAPAPSYASSAPSYSVPAPASSYTGSSSIIGSVAGSSDLAKSYQDLYNSTRNSSNQYSQQNTWADNKGNVYDTTAMTPQQTYALMLAKDNNPNASAILKGMGLDMNGNPTSPTPSYGGSNRPPTPAETKSGGGYLNASSGPVYAPPASANINAPKLGASQQSAMDWINNSSSGQGGLANYVKGQQAKYDAAIASGDQDMLSRLNADMQRVGYSLNTGNTGAQGNGAVKLDTGYAPGKNMFGLSDGDFAGVGAQADAQLKAERDGIVQAINGATSSLRNNYDYTNQITKDNRSIEDSQFQESNNPFNGMTSYRKSMLDRNRSIQDTASNKDYTSKLAELNQQLADFDSGSPAKKQAIVTQLAKDLASMHMQEAGLTGMYNGEKTVAAKAQDAASERQTKIDNWNAYIDSVGLTGYLGTGAKADWSLLGSKTGDMTPAAKVNLLQSEGAAINNEIAKLNLDYLPTKQKLEIQQLQKQIAQIGKAPYRSAEDVEYDKIKLDTAKEQLNQLRNPKTKTTDFKSSTEFASDVAHLKNNPNEASKLDSNPQPFIEAYGYDGYLALRKAAGLED